MGGESVIECEGQGKRGLGAGLLCTGSGPGNQPTAGRRQTANSLPAAGRAGWRVLTWAGVAERLEVRHYATRLVEVCKVVDWLAAATGRGGLHVPKASRVDCSI